MNNQRSLTLRSLSFFLAFSFLLTELSYSAPSIGQASLYLRPLEVLSQDPTRFEAPLEFSTLKEIHKGTNDTLIIHIQDAHSNLSGQQNLASTLDRIMTQYGVSLVLVEGGAHDGTLTPIKKIVPEAACKRLAKSLLMEGQIAGEEYLNLTSSHPMKIVGIEDISLYARSITSYGRLADKRESILAYLRVTENALNKLKGKLYPKEILAYEKKSREGDKGFELNFKGLLELAKTKELDLGEFPNVQKMASLLEKEKKVDFQAANLEQAVLMEKIGTTSSPKSIIGDQTKYDSRLKLSGMTVNQFSFFQNIFTIAKEKNISLSQYPNLILYGDYLKEFTELDLDQVLEELVRAEDKVYVSWLSDKDARLVRAIDRYIKLLETAYRIQMTTKDFNFFKANEPDFATVAYLAFINRKLADFGYFGDLISYKNILEEGKTALIDFYDSVDKRDMAFVQNTKRILDGERKADGGLRMEDKPILIPFPQSSILNLRSSIQNDVVVLITGGYHTPHLKQLFQKEGWSYVVLTPIVTSETNQKKYESLLLAPLKKEVKKVETVQGESKKKMASTLGADLILTKRSEGVRVANAFANLNAAMGLLALSTDRVQAEYLLGLVRGHYEELQQALEEAKKILESNKSNGVSTNQKRAPLPDLTDANRASPQPLTSLAAARMAQVAVLHPQSGQGQGARKPILFDQKKWADFKLELTDLLLRYTTAKKNTTVKNAMPDTEDAKFDDFLEAFLDTGDIQNIIVEIITKRTIIEPRWEKFVRWFSRQKSPQERIAQLLGLYETPEYVEQMWKIAQNLKNGGTGTEQDWPDGVYDRNLNITYLEAFYETVIEDSRFPDSYKRILFAEIYHYTKGKYGQVDVDMHNFIVNTKNNENLLDEAITRSRSPRNAIEAAFGARLAGNQRSTASPMMSVPTAARLAMTDKSFVQMHEAGGMFYTEGRNGQNSIAVSVGAAATNKDLEVRELEQPDVLVVDMDDLGSVPKIESHLFQKLFFDAFQAGVGIELGKINGELGGLTSGTPEHDAAIAKKNEVLERARKLGFEEILMPGLLSRRLTILAQNQNQVDRVQKLIMNVFIQRGKDYLSNEIRTFQDSHPAYPRYAEDIISRITERFDVARSFVFKGGIFYDAGTNGPASDDEITKRLSAIVDIRSLDSGPQRIKKGNGSDENEIEVSLDGESLIISENGNIARVSAAAIRPKEVELISWNHSEVAELKSVLSRSKKMHDRTSVIGFGTADPSPFAGAQDYTNFGIVYNGKMVLVDPSKRSVRNLDRIQQMESVGAIYLSHVHYDHSGGILDMVYRRLNNGKQVPVMPLIASYAVYLQAMELLSQMTGREKREIQELFQHIAPTTILGEVENVDLTTGAPKGLSFELARTEGHPTATYGLKLVTPHGRMAYLVDSTMPPEKLLDGKPNPRYIEFVRFFSDADLIISENGVAGVHITPAELLKAFPGHAERGTIYTVHSAGTQDISGLQRLQPFNTILIQTQAEKKRAVRRIVKKLIKLFKNQERNGLNRVPTSVLEKLARVASEQIFEKGKPVFEEGEAVTDNPKIYILESGTIAVGDDIVVGPGEILGEMAALRKSFPVNILEELPKYVTDELKKLTKQEPIGLRGYVMWGAGVTIESLEGSYADNQDLLNQLKTLYRLSKNPPRSRTLVTADRTRMLVFDKDEFIKIMRDAAGDITNGAKQFVESALAIMEERAERDRAIFTVESYMAISSGIVSAVPTSARMAQTAEVFKKIHLRTIYGARLASETLVTNQLSKISASEGANLAQLTAHLLRSLDRSMEIPIEVKLPNEKRITKALRAVGDESNGKAWLILTIADVEGGDTHEFEYPFTSDEMKIAKAALAEWANRGLDAQKILKNSASLQLDDAVAEFARLLSQAHRVENLVKNYSDKGPLLIQLVDSTTLTGGNDKFVSLVKGIVEVERSREQILGPERILLLNPKNNELVGLFDNNQIDDIRTRVLSSEPIKVNLILKKGTVYTAAKTDFEKQLRVLFDQAGDDKVILRILDNLGITVAPQPVFTGVGKEVEFTNGGVFSFGRIKARIIADNIQDINRSDMVVSFFRTMLPGARAELSNPEQVATVTRRLQNFDPSDPSVNYDSYTIAYELMTLNQILAFTQRALTAIGAAA